MRFARILTLALVTALAGAGCVSTPTTETAPKSHVFSADFESARTLAAQAAQLTGAARTANDAQIDALLSGLDNASLSGGAAALPAGDPLYNYAGRALLRRGLPLPRPFDNAQAWTSLTAARPPADSDGYRPPVKLAVLLPLTGSLAKAAAPVRDGLMAGYYGETRRRPQVQFYDTSGNATGALSAYQRAVAEGADYVVGPLGQDQVSALFQQAQLPVPLLVLNRGNHPPPAGSAGFSLAPEDDGVAAAEYLLARERGKALVIHGLDDNGRRAAGSFEERMKQRGGSVVSTISVADEPGDISAALTSAAQAGVDAVFLSIKGSTARAITPQLAFAGLGAKTRVATSQLSSGTGKAEDDAALDGIIFPTETWTSRGIAGLPAASIAAEQLATARGPAARLFAFGYDAWLLTGYMDKLATAANTRLAGATGTLQLDGFGNVVRNPAWSTFMGGYTTPVANDG